MDLSKVYFIKLIVKGLVFSIIIFFLTLLIVFLFANSWEQMIFTLSLFLLVESGLCLVLGGSTVSFSGLANRIHDLFLHSKTSSVNKRNDVERQGQILIVMGLFLFCIALVISVL